MLPVLLDAAASPNDATALIIAGLATCVAFLAGILSTVLLSKLGSLTDKHDAFEKAATDKHHALELDVERLKGFAREAHAELESMKKDRLTVQHFEFATTAQNKTLAEQSEALRDIRAQVADIEKTKASRTDMRAVRPPARRTDGPESEPPSEPPPTRRKLPSVGRYGAE